MKIRLEHEEIVRALGLYIRNVYGDKAIGQITVTEIKGKTYQDPPSFTLEADVTMPTEVTVTT